VFAPEETSAILLSRDVAALAVVVSLPFALLAAHVLARGRFLHGALLDAMIHLDVYLAMTGGQGALALDEQRGNTRGNGETTTSRGTRTRRTGPLPVYRASEAELAAHEALLDRVAKSAGGVCLFRAG